MGYRINPYKVARFIVILCFLVYLGVEANNFIKKRKTKTSEVLQTFSIRKKDFTENKETEKNAENVATPEKSEEELKIEEAIAENNKITENEEAQTNEAETEKLQAEKQKEEAEKKEIKAQLNNKNLNAETKAGIEAVQKKEENRKLQQEKEKKAREEAAKQKAKEEASKNPRKYIQVATLGTEAAAKSAVAKLGNGFSVQPIKAKSGKTMYRIISVSTDDAKTLAALEEKAKKVANDYIVRTAGK